MYTINTTFHGADGPFAHAISLTTHPTIDAAHDRLDLMASVEREDGNQVIRSSGGRYASRGSNGTVAVVEIVRAY